MPAPLPPSPPVSSAPPPRPEAPPLHLAAPDWHAHDTLLAGAEPPILWPVGNASLIAHWLDHAVRLGCRAVTLYCPDRPAAVRAALEGGAYWSLALDLRPTPPPPDFTGETLDHLPGHPPPSPAISHSAPQAPPAPVPTIGHWSLDIGHSAPAALLRWWLDLNLAWLAHRDPAVVQIDALREPGGWIGPRATLAPGVTLRPPYWIGAGAFIGPGCVIGPHALIGPGSVLSTDVKVSSAAILEGTFVGAHLDVEHKLLRGSTLLDAAKGARIDLTDDFIAAAMRRPAQAVPTGERLLAAALWPFARLLAFAAGPASPLTLTLPGGARLTLPTRSRGTLLARRASWLAAAAAGRLRLVGILPRAETPASLPRETRALLEHTVPGVFSLADLHGAHDPGQPDELAHALYQAALPEADREVRSALLRLAFARPSL